MSLSFIAICAFLTVLAVFLTTARVVGVRRIFKHSVIFDVVVSFGVGIVLAGTLTGMMVAIFAGFFSAVFLSAGKAVLNVWDKQAGRLLESHSDDLPSSGDWAVL